MKIGWSIRDSEKLALPSKGWLSYRKSEAIHSPTNGHDDFLPRKFSCRRQADDVPAIKIRRDHEREGTSKS